MRALALVVLALAAVARASLPDNAADLPLTSLLALAQDALAQGKSHDALSIYDHCLEREPGDFATLYKRASIRLATGQLAKAREGFQEVLKVREYDVVHLQLAKIHAKLAEYADAKKELDTYLKTAKKEKGAADKEVKEAEELRKQVLAAQKELIAAEKARLSNPPNLDRCLASSSSAIQLSPQSLSLRLLRAECALFSHDFDSAIGDLSRASALSPTLPQHLLVRIALLSAFFTTPPHSRPEISPDTLMPLKRCLSSDPDSRTCAKPLKQLKALEKDLAKLRNWIDGARWTEAALEIAGTSSKEGILTRVEGMLEAYRKPISRTAKADETALPADDAKLSDFSPLRRILHSALCHAYISISSRKSSAACASALALDPEDPWGMVGRADELMKKEEWDEAVRVLSAAFEATGRSERTILERLQKAQRLLKQSKSKDYYKILGVSRDADAKTIKRAYRKATLKAHPDKEGGSEEKMAQLNEAYEVLSDPDLRARFDAGDDPNDPTSGRGGFPGGGFSAGGQPIFFQSGGSGGGGPAFQQFFQQAAGAGGAGQFFQQFAGGGGGGGGQQFQFRWG